MPGPVTGGIASKIFADGTALLAGLADYPGQICTSADGVSWTVARSTSAGGTHGAVVNLNDVVYFTEVRPGRIDANSTTVNGVFLGGAHRLQATGVNFLDNTLVLGNTTGGFAAVTLQKSGTGFDAYPCATFGTGGTVTSSEYNGLYIATNSPDGIVDPLNIGIYQEQPGRGSHRRIYCTYGTGGVTTCYGFDAAGALTGILVADPIAWQTNATGEMGVGGVPEAGKALKVTGNVKFTGSISGDGSGLTGITTTGALVLKGSTDCSGNPNYPSAVKGDTYIVSVAGKIGGASGKVVEVGDLFIASADNAGGTQAGVGASWVIQQTNIDLASPGAIGGTTPAAGSFTTLTASGAVTLSTLAGSNITVNGGTAGRELIISGGGGSQYPGIFKSGSSGFGIDDSGNPFVGNNVSALVTLRVGGLACTGDATFTTSNLICATAGKGLQLKSGTGARAGNAVLVGGTVTVTNTTVTANSIIYCGRKTAGGTLGQSLSYTVSAGTSFTITSVDATGVLSALDTSTVSFIIVELN